MQSIPLLLISSDDGSSDVGSPRVILLGYDGLAMMPEDPYAYVEAAMQEPPSPDFVSEPVYPEFMPPEDDVLLAEEQPLPAAISPTADSPGYITESDLHRTLTRISIPAQAHVPFLSKAEVERLLALPTPPPSSLTSYSSPLPQIPSPPLPASPTHPLGYRAAMIRLRAKSPSTSHPLPLPLPLPIVLPHTRASMAMMRAATPSTYILAPRSETPPSRTPPFLPIPLSTSSPPLLLPSTDYRVDVPKVTLPPRKRLCIAIKPKFEVKECSCAPTSRPTRGFRADYGFVGTLDAEIRRDPNRKIGYGITDVWEDPDEIAKEIPTNDVAESGTRMTDFVTIFRQDTDEIYVRLDDAQDDRLLMSGQLNMIRRDRRSHARTARLMKSEARASREDRAQSMDASDTTCYETHMAALQSQQRPARGPAHLDVPEEAARDADRSRDGKDSHDSGTGVRRQAYPARECTYPDFMKCKPLYFKGTKGVVELTQWFERMETVFRISNCNVENQIKFVTYTLLGSALTWWNSHIKTVGHDVAYAMTWTNQKKDDRKELALMCARLFPEKSDKIERYVGGLPDMIHGSVMASKPKTMQDAIEFTAELMDKKINTFVERQAENKRKFNDTSRNNQNQQQPNKKENIGRAYTTGSSEKKPYEGYKPLCSKCNYHLNGPCAPKCHKCNRVGHLARDCRSNTNADTANNERGTGNGQKVTCFECGAQVHFKRECPKLKNNNQGNPTRNGNAPVKVYAVGHVGTNPNSNVVTGTFLINNRYASILFDTGADRSFVSIGFSSQIDITPTSLDHYYDVKLADERIVGLNNIIWGCTLNFLNHPFNIDLMPIELGSFNVIIGLPPTQKLEFQINLISGAAPVAQAPYQLALSEMKELSDQLKALSDKNFIRPSYHQLRVCEEDILNTTFRTRYSHYEFQVMRFGLTNTLAVFIDLMNRVCKPYLDKFVIVFIDDILTYSKNKKEHEEHLKAILELLKKEGEKAEAAFQLIKQKLCSMPILALLRGSEDFLVYCDASHKGLGAALTQREKADIATYVRKCLTYAKVKAEQQRPLGVVRFGKRGKLNLNMSDLSRYWKKFGSVAYKLELPQELSRVHNTFHVSNLKKCYVDEPLAVPLDGLHIDDKLYFVKEPVAIMDGEVKRLKRSRILIVKVRWNCRRGPEFT
nr:hypothetical protein [Tanacetum cinerariifolium]